MKTLISLLCTLLCLAPIVMGFQPPLQISSRRSFGSMAASQGGLRHLRQRRRYHSKFALKKIEATSADPNHIEDATSRSTMMDKFNKASSSIVNLFPVWTVLFAGAGLLRPEWFSWLTTQYFTLALAMLMISMGITLTPRDFFDVMKRPNAIALQVAGCYLMMPLLALFLGKSFALSPEYISGMVLVGSINGGQASNLCTYIAKGNVALSVIMTTATTLSAIVMTPLLCKSLLGATVPIDALGIAFSTIQVVLGPIAIGMTLKATKPKVWYQKSIQAYYAFAKLSLMFPALCARFNFL